MPGVREKSKHKGKRGEKNLAYDVDKYTKRGTNEIQNGNLPKALDYFQRAFVKAEKLGSSYPLRACAFNLGAVYIAAKEPEKGLEMLQCAIPPRKQNDGKSNGDLYYNFALGYEALKNPKETTKYLELALEEYQSEHENYKMEGDVAAKLGTIYMELQEWLSGARANGLAARAFSLLGESEKQAVCTSHEATCLLQGRRQDLALQIADSCMIVCQKVTQGARLGSVYNELGLTYSQCRDFGKAATCFELALPLSRSPWGEKSQEAVILQNLGAIYNTVGDFQRAIGFHEEAARRYAELNNRNAQGKCFTNLAFAYSQLYDTERAGEFYRHALQSSRDTGDKHAEWQAFEGLGAVAFNQGEYENAVQYFKRALAQISTSEVNKTAQDRIVAKLTDSIHFLAHADAIEEDVAGTQVDILVNDLPRPPTREELRQREIIALSRGPARRLGKRPNEFETVALGVSEYSTDDDASLERRSFTRSRSRSKRSVRNVKRASSLSSGHVTSRKLTDVDGRTPPPRQMKLTRRLSSVPRDTTDGLRRRNFNRSLLRADSNDSEEDRMKIVNQRRRVSSSAKKSSVSKGSMQDEDEPDDLMKQGMYPESQRPSSRHTMRSMSIVEASLAQSLKRVDMPDLGSMASHKQGRDTASASSYYSERMSVSEEEVRSIQSRRVVQEEVVQVQATAARVEAQQVPPVGTGKVEREEVASLSIQEVQEGKEEENEKEGEESESESESDEDGNEEHCEEGMKTDLSKLPPPPPIPMEQSPNATYMPPMNQDKEKIEEEIDEEEEESSDEAEETDSEEEESEKEELGQRFNRSMGNYMSSSRPDRSTTAHNSASNTLGMEDPIYSTITSAKSTAKDPPSEPQPGPSRETDEGPPLPPRPSFDKMTRAEMEQFLYDYQKKRDETIRRRESEVEKEAGIIKPNKKSGSKACVVM